MLRRHCVQSGKAKKGKPSKPQLMELVRGCFPLKPEADVLALKEALDRDAPKKKGAVSVGGKPWTALFEEDREGTGTGTEVSGSPESWSD
jgi:hypothetical protein